MKTSRRLLFGTFAVLLAAPAVIVAYSRFSGAPYRELPPPERTAQAELAALRDFTAVNISGDFSLELVRTDGYSVTYTPLTEERGNFTASVEDGTLTVQGFGNRTDLAMASVRIGLPNLDNLHVGFVPRVAIRDFSGGMLEANVEVTDELLFENNRLDFLDLAVQRGGTITMRANTFGGSRITHFGTTLVTE